MPEYKTKDVKYLIDQVQKLWGKSQTDFRNRETVFFKDFQKFINNTARKNYSGSKDKLPPKIGSYQTLMNYYRLVNTTNDETINATNTIIAPLKLCLKDFKITPKTNNRKFTANDLRGTWTVLFRDPFSNNKGKKVFTAQATVHSIEKKLHLELQLKGKIYQAPIEKYTTKQLYVINIIDENIQLSIHLNLTEQQQNFIFIGRYNGELPVFNSLYGGEIFLIGENALERHNLNKSNLSLPILAGVFANNPTKANSLTEVYHDFNGSKPKFIIQPKESNSNYIYSKLLNLILLGSLLILGFLVFSISDENQNVKFENLGLKENLEFVNTENSKSDILTKNTLSKLNLKIDSLKKDKVDSNKEMDKINDQINSLTSPKIKCLTANLMNIISRTVKEHISCSELITSALGSNSEDNYYKAINIYNNSNNKDYEQVIQLLASNSDKKIGEYLLLGLSYFYTNQYNKANEAFEKWEEERAKLLIKNYQKDKVIPWVKSINQLMIILKNCDTTITVEAVKQTIFTISQNENSPYLQDAKILYEELLCK